MKYVFLALGGALVVASSLSMLRSARWWIRLADFPRLQIAVLLAVALLGYGLASDRLRGLDLAFLAVLLAALAYQLAWILPYTPLAPRQVIKVRDDGDPAQIRLLISNVLMENRRADDLLALIREREPDLILAVETDDWWDEQLRALDRDYPHSMKQPQGNYYGMHLFSRLELRDGEVRFLVDEDVPSMRVSVRLRSGDWIDFFGVHPRPPEPQQDSAERDAEILIVGRQVRADSRPAIVAGDLNDVAWSHTTRLFQRISGTLDPRRGRGLFSTFHAKYPFLRWPLDHILHEDAFALVHLERLPGIGSDHFPVYAELKYTPALAPHQEAPTPDEADQEEAQQKVVEGIRAAS